MRLRARVQHVTGRTEHYESALEGDALVKVSKIPDPFTIEIEEGNNGFYLYYLDTNGNCIADTWHPSLSEAKAQAKFEFEINEQDWTEI